MQYRIVTRIIICDASGKKICITMPYYAVIGNTSDAEDEEVSISMTVEGCSAISATLLSF
ncbi:hypothetical protein T03_4454 [Trichinella britovi]|uniref:Uncharacterized protein n=1 Tax=Trichinella britovi TaxID=45882 RepID=A0A0V1CG93_TRIBR|nr:hypothetical protein T03_4454 [Trichinella britovi]